MATFVNGREFKASVERLFQLVVGDSLKQFGKSINSPSEEIIGLRVEKDYNVQEESKKAIIEVVDYRVNERYRMQTTIGTDRYIVTLDFRVLEGNLTKLTYTEQIVSAVKWKNISYKLVGCLSKKSFKRKVSALFDELEKKISQ